MSRIDELKAEKKKLEAENARLKKMQKTKKNKNEVIDTTKTVAENKRKGLPLFMQKESKY